MQFYLDRFTEKGARVIALCPQLEEFNQTIVSELGLGFPVLRDVDNSVSTAFGLTLRQTDEIIAAEKTFGLDLPAHNGSDNWDLPMPARYVIDASSTIRYATVHADHRMRTEPLECLESISS